MEWLSRHKVNIILFITTAYTTYYVNGPWYSGAIMAILLSHEMGHFVMCKKYKVESTLPFFIPVPFPPFGTFGAVIKMRGFIPNKRALFDIGAAGPLAGLVFALPAVIIGLSLSEVRAVTETDAVHYLGLGEPLLFMFLAKIVVGNVPEGLDIFLHPIAFAGWAGLFVTALNLLPIGQLDGGHIIYALLGRKSEIVYRIGILAFCAIALFYYPGWMLFAMLLLIFGFHHPAPMDEHTGLNLPRKLLGIFMLILFIVCFTPVPLKLEMP
ncbi:MAG: site-2 protease family protein [Candidatus Brocadiaceae bacterium]|nr:site-2 protease family protein [Candidatus Brocadiaceae bacterium]